MREKRPDSALDSITFRLRRCVFGAERSRDCRSEILPKPKIIMHPYSFVRESEHTHASSRKKWRNRRENVFRAARCRAATRRRHGSATDTTTLHIKYQRSSRRSASRVNVECDMEKSIKAVIRKQVRLESMTEHLRS